MQKDMTETHQRENNLESEQHLQENQNKFSRQCLKVLELLYQGKKLTTYNAPGYGILSLPRRIKDLRENGVDNIIDEWLDENGNVYVASEEKEGDAEENKPKRSIKRWYMSFKTDRTKKNVTEKWQTEITKNPEYIQQELLK